MIAVAAAAVLASASASADRAAVARAILHSGITDGCASAEARTAADGADLAPLGRIDGDPVVLAAVHGSCVCGNVNCAYVVVRLAAAPRVLLVTSAYEVRPDGGAPLPRLREESHDSAVVHIETIDAYRDGRYVPVASFRVRGDTGARKPEATALHFAPGAASARISGRVAAGWEDVYTFDAAAGQRLTLSGDGFPAQLEATLLDGGGTATGLGSGAATLPRSGRYRLIVETRDGGDRRYALIVSIR